MRPLGADLQTKQRGRELDGSPKANSMPPCSRAILIGGRVTAVVTIYESLSTQLVTP
jgi:hypothetical protein